YNRSTMANIDPAHWKFYLDGRGERRLLRSPLTEDEIAKDLETNGGDVRSKILEVATRAALPVEGGRKRSEWVAVHSEDLQQSGVSGEIAYAAYLKGRIDELAYAREPVILAAVGPA